MRKYLNYILILLILISSFGLASIRFSLAATVCPTPQVPSADGNSCVQPTVTTPTGTYQLLSPLPCDPKTAGPACTDKGLTTFDTTGPNNIGTYLNVMIRIFIGLCAVLAVVMIVMGGIEYMTSELPGNKENGKGKITNAIFGLLLALGAYALLFTINPDILNTDLSSLKDVTVQVDLIQTDLDSGPPSLSAFTGTPPSGPAGVCNVGVVKSATTGIVACSSVGGKVDQMVADAKLAGFAIFAGGFRTTEQQTKLRINNCNGNTTDKNAICKPATALPGHSEHESGVAFDIACNGSTITSKSSPCFTWLQTNASKYGLQNLKIGNEPWHWSIDGR